MSLRELGCTVRACILGSLLGIVFCFSNMYFGLQTGWVTLASVQAAVLGYQLWEGLRRLCRSSSPLSVRENVVLQTISVAAATMPLSAGFVGIIPALRLLSEREDVKTGKFAIVTLETEWEQILWSLAICFFGVFLAVPLRHKMLITDKLSFPTGTATAAAIASMHGFVLKPEKQRGRENGARRWRNFIRESEHASLLPKPTATVLGAAFPSTGAAAAAGGTEKASETTSSASIFVAISSSSSLSVAHGANSADLAAASSKSVSSPSPGSLAHQSSSLEKPTILTSPPPEGLVWAVLMSLGVSAAVALLAFLVPVLSNLPLGTWRGLTAVTSWGWTLTVSAAYMGQGIIMGSKTTLSMLAGAIVGYAILGPIVQDAGWTSGAPLGGSSSAKGFLLWVSLFIMLAEAGLGFLISIGGLLASFSCTRRALGAANCPLKRTTAAGDGVEPDETGDGETDDGAADDADMAVENLGGEGESGEAFVDGQDSSTHPAAARDTGSRVPHLPSSTTTTIASANNGSGTVPTWMYTAGLIISTSIALGILIPVAKLSFGEVFAALLVSLPISVVAIRALGVTDLNPVSGLGKIAQFAFAAIAPGNIVANVLAGGVAEAGAMQAGDLMSDLKTGYLLGVSPLVQFYAQLLGSIISVFAAVVAFKVFDSAFSVPSATLPAPTAAVWVSMATVVNGGSLPEGCIAVGGVAAAITLVVCAVDYFMQHRQRADPDSDRDGDGHRDGGRGLSSAGSPCSSSRFRSACVWIFRNLLPSPTAFAIGMYITPNWTIPRVLGSLAAALWHHLYLKSYSNLAIMVATGLVLGEGFMALFTALLSTWGVLPLTCTGCVAGLCGNACG